MVFNSAKKRQGGVGKGKAAVGVSACWGAMNYRSWQNSSSTNVWGDLVEERSFYFLPSRDWSLVIETGLLYQTLLMPTEYGPIMAISQIVLHHKLYLGHYIGNWDTFKKCKNYIEHTCSACFPLFNHYFYKKTTKHLHPHPKYLRFEFEFGYQRIRDIVFLCS